MKRNEIYYCMPLALWFGFLVTFLVWACSASAAEALPAVSPPTDWTGLLFLGGFLILLVCAGVMGYVAHARRAPGMQWGEEQIDAIANAVHGKMNPPPAVPVAHQLIVDGITFADQAKLDEYMAAKVVIDKFQTGAKT